MIILLLSFVCEIYGLYKSHMRYRYCPYLGSVRIRLLFPIYIYML